MENKLKVEHFLFSSEDDADLARKEIKKVEYLQKHIDYSIPQNVLLVYEKANKERIFRTPIGIQYMQTLRDFLIQSGIEQDKIQPITLYATYEIKLRTRTEPARKRVIESQKDINKRRLKFSILINILLVFAVLGMFAIALTSNNPNIINYKNSLVNQYSDWEQELNEREQIIREKELEIIQQE